MQSLNEQNVDNLQYKSTSPTNEAQGTRGEHCMKAHWDGQGQVHSDQMVLDCVSGGQRQLNVGHQASINLDQMVLMMARQGGWIA